MIGAVFIRVNAKCDYHEGARPQDWASGGPVSGRLDWPTASFRPMPTVNRLILGVMVEVAVALPPYLEPALRDEPMLQVIEARLPRRRAYINQLG